MLHRLALALGWICLTAVSLNAQSVETGFQSLFNGKDLSGWTGDVDGYEVVDGNLACKPGKGGVLHTHEEYSDFVVRFEFKLPPAGNNGLAIRYPGKGRASVDAMCEIQILDDTADVYKNLDPRQFNGAVYGMIAPKRGYLKPVGEWNEQEVTVIGSTIRIVLNGTEILYGDVSKVTEFKDNTLHPGKDLRSGSFGFAGHKDPVQFRNIRIQRLEKYQLGTFAVDITPPMGHRCMGILPQKTSSVLDPLEARGFIVHGSGDPIVLCALDWCEVRNGAYDQWRAALANAAGTRPERVLVTSLHQHDAPVVDTDAAKWLEEVGLKDELYLQSYHEDCLKRTADAVRTAMNLSRPITHYGIGQAIVEHIASSRRVVQADGKISFGRGSSSGGDPFHRDAEEGAIDPALRTLSFWNEGECLLELHAYATHPMSSYGKGMVSSDFVGLARRLRQSQRPKVFQVYVSGCSGDVTAGKYNDGSQASRAGLIQRLNEGMIRSSDTTEIFPLDTIQFRNARLALEYSPKPELTQEALEKRLRDPNLATEQRILAAMGLASRRRVEAQKLIDMPCIHLSKAKVLLFPGESFVGYQLQAQTLAQAQNAMLLPIGYGECWTGYIPTEKDFAEGFGDSWVWVAPGSESKMQAAMQDALRATTK